jgi:hypothetical protein
MQHGALFGPTRSSVIVRVLFGLTSAARGQTVERCSTSTLAGRVRSSCLCTTTLALCVVFRVLSRSIIPTPGIFALPASERIASTSTLHSCAASLRFVIFRRSHVRGHGMVLLRTQPGTRIRPKPLRDSQRALLTPDLQPCRQRPVDRRGLRPGFCASSRSTSLCPRQKVNAVCVRRRRGADEQEKTGTGRKYP